MQSSSLRVSAFSDSSSQATLSAPAGNSSSDPPASQPPAGTNSTPHASVAQLAGVYVVQPALTLSQLATMNGSLVTTQDSNWLLLVSVGPPAVQGVSLVLTCIDGCFARMCQSAYLQACLLISFSTRIPFLACRAHP